MEYLPNGLPIGCMKGDLLLECEHGDHPDYKFPITVDFIGDTSMMGWTTSDGNGGIKHIPASEADLEMFTHETHAVIYTDGFTLITMNECCYAMWSARDGECWGGNLWKKKEWKVSEESLKMLKPLVEEMGTRSKR